MSADWRVLFTASTYAYSEYRDAQRLAASHVGAGIDPVHTLAHMERAEWHCAELDRAALEAMR